MQLHTSRLTLRPFRLEDVPDVTAYTMRPEFIRYLPLPPQTPASTAEFVRRAVDDGQPDKNSNWKFAIQIGEDPRLVGTIRVGIREAEHRQGDVGYALNPDFWGRGIITEALSCLLAFGFDELDLMRIWATADARNIASWAVMERAGMKREGLMRRHRFHQGEWCDSVLYAAVAGDPGR